MIITKVFAMIDYLHALVQKADKQAIVIEVARVGFLVAVPDGYRFVPGSQVKMYTFLHWNQEQGPTLFGFSDELERTVFTLIIGCSGIGPKIALSLLGHLGPTAFLQAVHKEDCAALASVTGIGAKKAEQIVVNLKHKVAKIVESGILQHAGGEFAQWHEITQALESLNYSKVEVSYAMNKLKSADLAPNSTFDQLLRKALVYLTK